ncbi:signal transduction histidine kinase [Sphaerotilus hippei]|uniref:histidine kinase n=1 Tax=Sphaerotilus hippei TaxID=744406 RepID=A0A318H0Q8_9BURK|nr:ATP-binding protein [Sphaerotilus hippei]PXW96518.1 signal transduction histidine kinase [Sphaerotilus hippei]
MNDAFRMLFDQVRSGVVWVGRNGQVRYANKAAVQLTPCMLGRPFMDPVVDRHIKSAVDGLAPLPFQFELRTQEVRPDTVKAVIIPAPVGNDLMLVLNNVSEERWFTQALENLIHYIDAEMSRPIERLVADLAALPGGLALLEQGRGQDAGMAADAAALSDRLGRLRDLVKVFGSGAIQCDDRLVMSQVLRSALDLVATSLDERNVTVTLTGVQEDLAVYGSPTWLPRALVEYLDQAIRSSARGSVIELSLSGAGTRIVLRSRSRGLFVSNQDRRNAYVPFGVGSGADQAHPRIGLALARYVVEQHGGSVRIDDEYDTVDFVLELPAGAPADQGATQLSMEQAQRYARDMAQLMARSTQRRAPKPA